jgi:formylglycine-generating enzyme required for sulfatase activity
MVGNVWEWVADWVPQSTLVGPSCVGWGAFSDDYMCLSGASTIDQGPGALLRGGDTVGARAGPLAVDGSNSPAAADDERGFRCAR